MLGLGLHLTSLNSARRAGFSPLELFANGEVGAWFDPSDSSTLFQDSDGTTPLSSATDPIGQVVDLSGNGNHLTQATNESRPVGISVNGRQMIRTTGSPTRLSCDALADVFAGSSAAWSVHLVVSQQSAGNGTLWSAGNSANANHYIWQKAVIPANLRAEIVSRAGGTASGVQAARLGAFEQVVSAVCNGTSVDLWINGIKIDEGLTLGAGSYALDRFTLGALERTTVAYYGACRYGEIIIREGSMDDATTARIHQYLAGKWLPTSLDVSGVVDLFIIAGQSNAEGRGTGGPDVPAGAGYEIDGGAIRHLADPVGGAASGSAWPALANKWRALTGRTAFVAEIAYGGSGLVEGVGSGNNWTTGTLKAAAAGVGADAQGWLSESQTLGKVFIIWAQGERDAISVDGETVTGALYEAALDDLVEFFDANLPQMDGFLISALGLQNDGEMTPEYAEIRVAQESVAADRADTHVAFDRAQYFPGESKMTDNVHYNQTGLNEMGEAIAVYAAGLL